MKDQQTKTKAGQMKRYPVLLPSDFHEIVKAEAEKNLQTFSEFVRQMLVERFYRRNEKNT